MSAVCSVTQPLCDLEGAELPRGAGVPRGDPVPGHGCEGSQPRHNRLDTRERRALDGAHLILPALSALLSEQGTGKEFSRFSPMEQAPSCYTESWGTTQARECCHPDTFASSAATIRACQGTDTHTHTAKAGSEEEAGTKKGPQAKDTVLDKHLWLKFNEMNQVLQKRRKRQMLNEPVQTQQLAAVGQRCRELRALCSPGQRVPVLQGTRDCRTGTQRRGAAAAISPGAAPAACVPAARPLKHVTAVSPQP